MKLNQATRSVETGGQRFNVGFKIDMNAKAFNVLSDGQYEDGVTSIVRELSSNAFDAHVAAGTPELPFEVSCPNAFDPYFLVRDTGIGLRYHKFNATVTNKHDGESTLFIDGDVRDLIEGIDLMVVNGTDTFIPNTILLDKETNQTVIRVPGNLSGEMEVEFDDALVLYTTYFRSTKEESDDFVGAFGLGSKTPFAYTDNFQVTNTFEGTRSVFNVYTDENGHPQISLFGRFETDEPNGLEVKLAVSSDDYNEFKAAIESQLMGFHPLPTILNEEVDIPQVIHRGEHFLLMDRDLGTASVNVVMGNNSYRVHDWGIHTNGCFRRNCVLRFDIGELQPTSSRESLRLDGDAIALINQRAEKAMDEYRDYIMSTLADAESMTEEERIEFSLGHSNIIPVNDARIREFVGNPNLIHRNDRIDIPLTWGIYNQMEGGVEEVHDEDGNVVESIPYFKRTAFSPEKRPLSLWKFKNSKMMTRERSNRDFVSYGESVAIFVKDSSHSFMKKIRYSVGQQGINAHDTHILILDNPSSEEAQDALGYLQEVLPDLIVTKVSDIELPKNTSISTTATREYTTPVGRVNQNGRLSFRYGTQNWDDMYTPLTRVEQDEDMYIVEVFRNDIQHSEEFTYNDEQLLGLMTKELDGTTIIALSTAKYEKALTYGFQPISKLVDKLKEELVVDNGFANRDLFEQTVKSDDGYGTQSIEDQIERLENVFEGEGNDTIKHIIRVFRTLQKRYSASRFGRDRRIAQLLEIEKEPSEKFVEALDNFVECCDNLWNTVKIVKHFDMYRSTPEEQNDLREFLNWKLENTGAEA